MSNGLNITKPKQVAPAKQTVLSDLRELTDQGMLDKSVFDHLEQKLTEAGELHLHMDMLNEKVKRNNEALKNTKEYGNKMKLKGFTKYKKAEIEQTNHEIKGSLEVVRKQLIANGLPEKQANLLKM